MGNKNNKQNKNKENDLNKQNLLSLESKKDFLNNFKYCYKEINKTQPLVTVKFQRKLFKQKENILSISNQILFKCYELIENKNASFSNVFFSFNLIINDENYKKMTFFYYLNNVDKLKFYFNNCQINRIVIEKYLKEEENELNKQIKDEFKKEIEPKNMRNSQFKQRVYGKQLTSQIKKNP